MRVFFAGASGAVGPPAVRELMERGHEVVAMTSSAAKAPMLAELGAEPVVADAMDPDALTRAVRAARPDAVVNMLTRIPAKPARPAHMRATNELRERGVRHLLDAAVAAGARRFVSESFFGVYGFGPYERPRTEDDPVGHERNRGIQAVIDAIASSEAQVRAASDEQRIEGVSLRFAAFHGPLAPNMAVMAELVRKRRLPVIGAHGATMPTVELGDAVRAVADALERAPAGRIYNVVDDEPVAWTTIWPSSRGSSAPRRRAMSRTGSCASPRRTWRPSWAVRGSRCPTPGSRTSWAGARGTRPTARRSPCSVRPSISRRSARAGPARWPRSGGSRAASRSGAPTPGPGSSRRRPSPDRRWSRAAGGRGRASRP